MLSNQIFGLEFGHFTDSIYLCRCVLKLIETNYIRKDALHSNAREVFIFIIMMASHI